MFPRSLFMFLCLQMRSCPILCCFEHLRSQEAPPNLAIIPKIDDFLSLRLMRPLEAQTCDTNVIFLMPNRYHIKYMKNSWYIMGGAHGGAPCTWWYASKLNFYVKIETTCLLFLVESLFNHRTAAPPHPPPHNASYKIWKYNMWPLTRIKNHVS